MVSNRSTSGSASDWAEQLRLACQALSRSKPSPAMVIQITGELKGAAGQAMPLLLLAKCIAAEHGLKQQASLQGRTLGVRLSTADVRFQRERLG